MQDGVFWAMNADRPAQTGSRLESWKEVASFFDRDVKTVQRWERELGLPVYRYPGSKGRIYAFSEELKAWAARPRTVESDAGNAGEVLVLPVTPVETPLESGPDDRPVRRTWIALVGLALLLAAVAAVWQFSLRRAGLPPNAQAKPHQPLPDAEKFYLKGRFAWNKRTPDSLREAVDDFTQAVVHDPAYAEAYVGLADTYNLMREYAGMDETEAYARSLAAARKAVEIEPNSAGAQASLGFALFYGQLDVAGGEAAFQRAVDLDPTYVDALHWYGNAMMTLGQYAKAADLLARAQRISPGSAAIRADAALNDFVASKSPQALQTLLQMTVSDPQFQSPWRYLAQVNLGLGDCEGFLRFQRKLAEVSGAAADRDLLTAGEAGLRSGGCKGVNTALVQYQERAYAAGAGSAFSVAEARARAGDLDGALVSLRECLSRRELSLIYLRGDTYFIPLHSRPEFQQMLKQVGLPPVE